MNSNQKIRNLASTSSVADLENLKNAETTSAPPLDAIREAVRPGPGNDNAAAGGIPDTTYLVARSDVVQYIRATLLRYGTPSQDMADAIAEVQAASIEAARTTRMPADGTQWKALASTIAARFAIDRRRRTEVRVKYDAGPCEDADDHLRPTLYWEEPDPLDVKRYLAVLKELFDSGAMPEDGEEILWGAAERVPHAQIAAELGVTRTVVDNRLSRMRATFRKRLAALGLLTLLLMLAAFVHIHGQTPVDAAPATAPPPEPMETAPPLRCVPAWDAGTPGFENSSCPAIGNWSTRD